MDESDLAPVLRKLTGALKPLESAAPDAMEQAGWAIALAARGGQKELLGGLAEGELSRVMAALPESKEPGGVRVFRREAPIATELAADSVPSWAAGQAVDQTFGPFLDAAGQRFWIDVWRFIVQTSIVNAFTEQVIAAVPMLLFARAGLAIELPAGSVWCGAAPFDAGSPKKAYFGVRIRNGVLRFSSLPALANGTLRVSPGTVITLELTLDPPEAPPVPAGSGGGEARRAKVRLPGRVVLSIVVGGSGSLLEADDAESEVYGDPVRYSFRANAPARFEPAMQRLLFPFETDSGRFRIVQRRSNLFLIEGHSRVETAGWTPALAVPANGNPANLGSASGAGAMVLALEPGLRGQFPLPDAGGDLDLRRTFVMLEPGMVTVLAVAARSRAHATLDLWQRSHIDLRARQTVDVRYFATTRGAGAEVLELSGLRSAAQPDRPLSAAGDRVPIDSESARLAFLVEGNLGTLILNAQTGPAIDPVTGRRTQPAPLALVLKNSLLRVSQATQMRLSGPYTGGGRLDAGNLAVNFRLLRLIPTLPDPYAANISVGRDREPPLLLPDAGHFVTAQVSWEAPAKPALSFEIWSAAGGRLVNLAQVLGPPAQVGEFGTSDFQGILPREDSDRISVLDGTFREAVRSDRDYFRLLDVSSNADQFGVGYLALGGREIGQDQPLLGLRGLDFITAGQRVTVFTLPAFQWEPVYNIPNPEINENFPRSLHSDVDGGPTRLAVPTATLVPIAPLPVLSAFLGDYNREKDPAPLAARLTLPFGAVAVARLEHERLRLGLPSLLFSDPFFHEIRPEFPTVDMTGALQVSLQAPATLLKAPDAVSPSLRGATVQLANGHERFQMNLAGYKSVLGFDVAAIFNGEFEPASKFRRVPVTRIDVTGYGASLFSDWRNPGNDVPGIAQVRYDTITGRTLHEVVQAKSLLYPWGPLVVRTITMQRAGSGGVFRRDSGWQPASDAEYKLGSIVVHPGVIPKLTNIRHIRDTSVRYDRTYPIGHPHNTDGTQPQRVLLTQVIFDADAVIENVSLGANSQGLVPVCDLVGYVQLMPPKVLLTREQLSDLFEKTGPIGGPIDCELNVGRTNVHMRVSRIEVDRTTSEAMHAQFAAVARGTVELPDVGEWSAAFRGRDEPEFRLLPPSTAIPLIRARYPGSAYHFAEPSELNRPDAPWSEYGFVQSTKAQRMLVPRPRLLEGDSTIYGGTPLLFADTYALAGGVSMFPQPDLCHPMPDKTVVRVAGRRKAKLEIPPQPGLGPNQFRITMPDRTLSTSSALRVRTKYLPGSTIEYVLDSSASPNWTCNVGPVGIRGDFDSLEDLVQVIGMIKSSAGVKAHIADPHVEFGGALSPVQAVIDLLTNFGLAVPYDMDLTNFEFGFKSGMKFTFPLGDPATELIAHAIKAGPGILLEVEILSGFGKESKKPGHAYDGALSDNGVWHFYVEISSKVQSKIIHPFPIFLGGGSKVKIEGKSEGKTEVSIYWSVIGTVEPEVPKLIKISGSRIFSIVSRFTIGEKKVGLGTSQELEVEGSLVEGLAAVKFSCELLILMELVAGEFGMTGEATVAIDVTVGWIFNKTFEVKLEMDEKMAAAAFIATSVLPMTGRF